MRSSPAFVVLLCILMCFATVPRCLIPKSLGRRFLFKVSKRIHHDFLAICQLLQRGQPFRILGTKALLTWPRPLGTWRIKGTPEEKGDQRRKVCFGKFLTPSWYLLSIAKQAILPRKRKTEEEMGAFKTLRKAWESYHTSANSSRINTGFD